MIHKTYTIRFVLHRRSDTPRQHLQMRVTPRGQKPVSFATGLSLTAQEWDPLVGMARGRTKEAAEANSLIMRWSSVVDDLFIHYNKLNIVPTPDQLRKDFARATAESTSVETYTPQPSVQPTLQAAFTQFIMERQKENEWSQGTISVMMYYKKLLAEFRPNALINDIDVPWLEAFHQWLVDKRNQQGVTVKNNITRLKWFLKWAARKGIYNGRANIEYNPKVKGANELARQIVYLTRDELRQLEEYEFKEKQYQRAKDVFLFCCYTGLRTSDVLTLTNADCHDNYICITTQKTNHELAIPLNDKARTILAKYTKYQPNRYQKAMGIINPALPATARKAMNRSIHVMMQKVGIDAPTRHTYYIGSERHDEIVPKYKLISTHTARHTFIVTAISLGISPVIIMNWTGHKNYEAMRPYIAIASSTSSEAMQLFNTL